MHTDYDLIIIGSGSAGLSAAIYASRGGLRTLVLERETMGGEQMNLQLVENYPGFAEGVQGPELGSAMLEQAMRFGTEIEMIDVTGVKVASNHMTVLCEDKNRTCKSIIVATGAVPRKLRVPGEEEFLGSGVFYCGTCDGPGFAGKPVAVAGAGDSGITEALSLEKLGCKITVIEFMAQGKASKIMLDRAVENPNIEIKYATKIENIVGDGQVKGVQVLDLATGTKSELAVDGVCVRIGVVPNSSFLKGVLTLSPTGQIPVNDNMESAIPGIFAAGDVREHSMMQLATAAGDGVTAAMAAGRFIQMSGSQSDDIDATTNLGQKELRAV